MMIMIFKGPQAPPHATHFDEHGSFFWTLFLILKKGSQKSPLRPPFWLPKCSSKRPKNRSNVKKHDLKIKLSFFIDVCPTLAPKVEAPNP